MTHSEKNWRAREFAKEHWPKMAAGTVAGAAILLLIHFYRKHKEKEDGAVDTKLDHLEQEAAIGRDPLSTILETGIAVMKTLPPESVATATEMASVAPTPQAQESMETLAGLAKK